MTWTLLSRSMSLPADPLHVALHRDLLHGHDLAVLDHHQPRSVSRPMVLVRVGEGRGDAPRVPFPEGLERLLHSFPRRGRARALYVLGGHERPQPAAHVRPGTRGVR